MTRSDLHQGRSRLRTRVAAALGARPPADQCLLDASFTRPKPSQVPHRGMMTYSSDDLRKVMGLAETKAWVDSGKELGYVRQDGKTDALEGFAGGKRRAEHANRQLDERGAPEWLPIVYVAQDSGITAAQYPAVAEFFRGIFSVRSGRPAGRYGGGNVFRYLDGRFGADAFAINWKAAATSWGDYPAAHMVQQVGAPWYPIPGVPTDDNIMLWPFARWGAGEVLSESDRRLLAAFRSAATDTTRLLS